MQALTATVYVNPYEDERARTDVLTGHAVVALRSEEIVAFRCQRRVGSDVLGFGLMVVRPDCQNQGIGRAVVDYWEQTLPSRWALSLLVNSDGYDTVTEKPDATRFWESCGYELAWETEESRVLVKRYR